MMAEAWVGDQKVRKGGVDLPQAGSGKHNGGGGVAARAAQTPGNLPTPREKEIGAKEKVCRNCKRTKIAVAFPRNRKVRDGLSSWCKGCHNEAVRSHNARRRAAKETPRRENQ